MRYLRIARCKMLHRSLPIAKRRSRFVRDANLISRTGSQTCLENRHEIAGARMTARDHHPVSGIIQDSVAEAAYGEI